MGKGISERYRHSAQKAGIWDGFEVGAHCIVGNIHMLDLTTNASKKGILES